MIIEVKAMAKGRLEITKEYVAETMAMALDACKEA